jgi:hypothetical protein
VAFRVAVDCSVSVAVSSGELGAVVPGDSADVLSRARWLRLGEALTLRLDDALMLMVDDGDSADGLLPPLEHPAARLTVARTAAVTNEAVNIEVSMCRIFPTPPHRHPDVCLCKLLWPNRCGIPRGE